MFGRYVGILYDLMMLQDQKYYACTVYIATGICKHGGKVLL